VDEDADAMVEREYQVLAPPSDAVEPEAQEFGGCRYHRFEGREPKGMQCGEESTTEGVMEAFGQRLHLG
jgi:hypothetical protein